jgi:hypothetical protein
MKNYKIISIIFFFALYLPFFAFSQELQGKFHDWSVFKITNQGKDFCYIASVPINISGNIQKTGEAFFLVTKIIEDSDEISSSLGSIISSDSNIELAIGNQKYVLFPYQAMLWANNKIDDINIIKAMQQQADFSITAVLENNKSSVYTYSLIGFTESYSLLKKICK